ncbi:MAG: hypothetical protein H5T36_00520 [Methanobacteriaceae archaeon]|nr:hypothetical protein [Methanobacteriaceae archaeon]
MEVEGTCNEVQGETVRHHYDTQDEELVLRPLTALKDERSCFVLDVESCKHNGFYLHKLISEELQQKTGMRCICMVDVLGLIRELFDDRIKGSLVL